MSRGEGTERTVYVAHAWVGEEERKHTVGPWHFWKIYNRREDAVMQAARAADRPGWGGWAMWEVVVLNVDSGWWAHRSNEEGSF